MNRMMITCGVGLAFAATAFAQSNRGPRVLPRLSENPTLKLLNQRIPEVSIEEQPLESVMEWIQELTQANVVVRWEKLEDNSIERDKPISLKVRNLRLSQVLWMIMSQAGGSDVKLAYRAEGNLLILSTEEDLGKEMITKVYDVSDLLTRPPRFTNAPRIDPSQALQNSGGQGGGGGGGGGGSNIFESDDEEDDEGQQGGLADAETAALVQMIIDTIEPDSWQANNGLGSIIPWRGQIVVRNTLLVHQRLGGAIEESED